MSVRFYNLSKEVTVPFVHDNSVITVFNGSITQVRIGLYCSLYLSPDKTPFDPDHYQIIDNERYTIIANKTSHNVLHMRKTYFISGS